MSSSADLADRWSSGKAAVLFARNTAVSVVVFGIGLALMWLCVEQLSIDQFAAAAISFVVANSLHYVFGRVWIYRGTERGVTSGYIFFLIAGAVGLAVTLAVFSVFASLGLHYLWSRLIASVFAGIAMFALNSVLNFRCL